MELSTNEANTINTPYLANQLSYGTLTDMKSYFNPYMMMTTPMRTAADPVTSQLDTPSSDESGLFEGSSYNYSGMVAPPSNPYPYQLPVSQETSPTQVVPGCSTPEETEDQASQDERSNGGGPIRRKLEIVKKVQGRLNIVNNHRSYDVSKEEVLRRIDGVEKMTGSTLAALLKESKVKDAGSKLREQLAGYGIQVKTNNRGSTGRSVFTCLVEAESMQIARDFDVLMKQNFPFEEVSQKLLSGTNTQDMYALKDQMRAAEEAMRKVSDILNNTRVPLSFVTKKDIQETGPYQDKMEQLSEMTHGFIMQNMVTWGNSFHRIFQETANLTEKFIEEMHRNQQWANHMMTQAAPTQNMGVPQNMGQHQMWNNAPQYQQHDTQNSN